MKLDHSIRLNSIQNARELGGYVTADGKKTKNGVLLRTASLNGISDEDIRTLTQVYRVKHIIDLRMAMEMVGADDPPIGGAQYHHLNVIDLSTLPAQDAPEVDFRALDIVQMVKLSEQFGMLADDMYIGFLEQAAGKAAYAEFFRILLSTEPDRAVLWHCTSGKDRTGLAAMLLLSALGVDEESVVSDYLLTNKYNAKRIAGTRQALKAKGCDDTLIEKAVIVFDAVNERFMRSVIAYLKQKYGSVIGYILDGLDIKQAEIDSLKEKYLL